MYSIIICNIYIFYIFCFWYHSSHANSKSKCASEYTPLIYWTRVVLAKYPGWEVVVKWWNWTWCSWDQRMASLAIDGACTDIQQRNLNLKLSLHLMHVKAKPCDADQCENELWVCDWLCCCYFDACTELEDSPFGMWYCSTEEPRLERPGLQSTAMRCSMSSASCIITKELNVAWLTTWSTTWISMECVIQV